MDLDQLRAILDLVREHELSEFEIEHEGLRLKVRKDGTGAAVVTLPAAAALPGVVMPASAMGAAGVAGVRETAGAGGASMAAGAAGAAGEAGGARTSAALGTASQTDAAAAVAEAADAEIELAVVKSPIVGTFYRSPEPGSPAFVEIGTTVKKGQVLCIIEAMKLMNEIDSEYDGEIVNIYVEGGQAVQYGERLFAIRTR